jgi:hypothetical protein
MPVSTDAGPRAAGDLDRDFFTRKLKDAKHLVFTRWKLWADARFLLFCLCLAGIVQVPTRPTVTNIGLLDGFKLIHNIDCRA